MSDRRKKLIIYIILTLTVLAVYWQVNGFDFLNYDDPIYVTENNIITSEITFNGLLWSFTTTRAEFWHPLTWLSLMANYQLYGLNAGGYHVTNLILHILSTLLLFWLFSRMTKQIWPSAFVAAFFALHPLHVESVAWVSERKDVLSAFFWMLTLCLYVYYTEKPVRKRYMLVLFSFVLALMSKPMVVTLPLIMILLDYWPLRRFQSQKDNLFLWQLKEKLLFLILSAVISIITIYAQPTIQLKNWPPPLESRLINSLGAFVVYLEKIFWPQGLTVSYPFLVRPPLWEIIGATLLIVFISAAAILTIKKCPCFFVGWLWYIISLLPVIGIIQVGNNAMADHFTYLPLIGISIMLAWRTPLLFKSENMHKMILLPASLALLIILSIMAWIQCGYWKNSFTLFSHALQVNEQNYQAHINLASYLVKKGNVSEAIDYYNKAIRIKPDQSDAYNNRGIAYDKTGLYQRAIQDFNKAISLQPNHVDIYINRANFYFNQGDKASGCRDAQKACELGSCETLIVLKEKNLCD